MKLRSPPSTQPSANASPLLVISVVLLVLCTVGIGVLVAEKVSGAKTTDRATALRQVASKLKAAGALDEAAELYAAYFHDTPNAPKRAQVAFSIGNTYLEMGQYQKALRWYYEAEAGNPPTLRDELAKKIVHCLERLGKVHAAQAALAGNVDITQQPVKRSTNDAIVAKVGTKDIHKSDLDNLMDQMPPEMAAQFQGANKTKLLQKYVTDELLWRKAQKLEYHQSEVVSRKIIQVRKHLTVAEFVEKEVFSKITVDPADLKTFFEAHKEKYAQDGQPASFESSQQKVAQDYKMMKAESAYAALVQDELATGDVQMYPENL